MNPSTRTLATGVAAFALAVSGLLFASGPASAATSCLGSTCDGLDPSTTVCQNDARTVARSAWGVELRYSPTCRAAWARKTSGASFDTDIRVTNDLNQSYSAYYGGNGTVFTRMVNDKDITARACELRSTGSNCTDRY
ncbi:MULTISPECIES: DUF2690 domain-containing protein [unclassified Streptomyces]|uniref:DUF2690 domain-containing protein n=1 Tax=unclassified Streptomyces TaxID=2593676 RepID=UPI0033F953B5